MKSHCPALTALLLTVLALIRPAGAADPDSLQARIYIAAMVYDDGFGVQLKSPSGMCFDPEAGEIFVADAGNGRVVVYDRQLNSVYSFVHYTRDPVSHRTIVGEPKGLAVNRRGDILLNDSRSDVLDLLDFRGRVIDACQPNRLLGDTSLRVRASCVAADDHDNFYILVTGDVSRILVVDQDLKLLRQMGEKGDLPAQFNTPVAIAVHHDRIYVGDLRGTPAVKVFDTLGQFLSGIGGHSIEKQDLTYPVGFGFLADENGGEYLLVADGLRQTTKVYTASGEFFTMIGGAGSEPGSVQYPSGLVSDGVATFYVLERVGGRIQKYEIR